MIRKESVKQSPSEIISICAKGKQDVAIEMIRQSKELIYEKSKSDRSVLRIACAGKLYRLVKFILEIDPNTVNDRNKNNHDIITDVYGRSDKKLRRVMIKTLSEDFIDDRGNNLLMMFQLMGAEFDEIIEHFDLHGVDLNHENLEGLTVLNLAVRQRNVDMVQFLVDIGFDTGKISKENKTPLMDLFRFNMQIHDIPIGIFFFRECEIIDLLLRSGKCRPDHRDNDNRDLLYYAIMTQNEEMILKLIQTNGFDLTGKYQLRYFEYTNYTDVIKNDQTLLDLADYRKFKKTFMALLRTGVFDIKIGEAIEKYPQMKEEIETYLGTFPNMEESEDSPKEITI